jgi:hypothetical protein
LQGLCQKQDLKFVAKPQLTPSPAQLINCTPKSGNYKYFQQTISPISCTNSLAKRADGGAQIKFIRKHQKSKMQGWVASIAHVRSERTGSEQVDARQILLFKINANTSRLGERQRRGQRK